MDVKVVKQNGLIGEIEIPSDKSISHRAILFSLLMKEGTYLIRNFSLGEDCLSSIDLPDRTVEEKQNMEEMFGTVGKNDLKVVVPKVLKTPKESIDCGNSGTTMRLLTGILASKGIEAVLVGDESLSKRPMKRVIEPLNAMRANILSLNNDNKAPIVIKPSKNIKGIVYDSKLASAQVKSCLLLCGMQINDEKELTSFIEPSLSRDHSERLIKYLDGEINIDGNKVTIKGAQKLTPKDIIIPGDISSASFFIAGALIVPNSNIKITNVNLNPTRKGFVNVLMRMGADIQIINERIISNEEVGDIVVRTSNLTGTEVCGDEIPKLIDEIPILCVVALFAKGKTVIKDAADLKNKETDRIMATYKNLSQMGGKITPTDDGFVIEGSQTELFGKDASLDCYHDHRIAMSSYVCGLMCKNEVTIKEFEWVNISFPTFLELFKKLKNESIMK
ncbi:MAG: 3-phosphoshikimate 1-carboxyvinyltransferase [Candidatus Melainabacteria bacterium LEY3_CP_29_8]|nr:MAG: 3-phosphoshikimate 1-carboxyvinyltransferase [Candidatus Melainabacteria bacterium LEY3_CP_29_8]